MNTGHFSKIVGDCIRKELEPGATMPAHDEDLVESGAVDSMAWISVVRCVERGAGVAGLGEHLMEGPRSAASLLQAIQAASSQASREGVSPLGTPEMSRLGQSKAIATITGWGTAVGQRRVPIAEVEREFRLPEGKLQSGAGIDTVARIADGEDEASLGAAACDQALRTAGASLAEVGLLIATSETCAGFPQLGAQVHARLLAGEKLGVLDVGGACMGLVNAFIVAKGLIESGAAQRILVVTADVHSRILTAQQVKGEFGGLFGDGASAFVLRSSQPGASRGHYRLGQWLAGGNSAYARAINVKLGAEGRLAWAFEGEALARAAVERLEMMVGELEERSGTHRGNAHAFATHQPNPRLVDLLARQLGVPVEKFPPVARTFGNLGSSTCGTALAMALAAQDPSPTAARGPMFLASLAPGLLWSGMALHPAQD